MRLAPAARNFDRLDRNLAVALREILDPPSAPYLHAGKGFRMMVENRLDENLADAMLRLGRRPSLIERAMVAATHRRGGEFEAPEQMAAEARDIQDIGRMVARQSSGAKLVSASEAPKMLHRARVGSVAFRIGRLGGDALLEEQARHAAPSEIHREGESDRPSARDDYRNFVHRLQVVSQKTENLRKRF